MRFVTVLVSKWTKLSSLSCLQEILPHLWDYSHGEVWVVVGGWCKTSVHCKGHLEVKRFGICSSFWESMRYPNNLGSFRLHKKEAEWAVFFFQLLCVCSIKFNFIYLYQFNKFKSLSQSFAENINCFWNFPGLLDYYYNW